MAAKKSKKKPECDEVDIAAARLPRHAFAHRSHRVAKTISVILVTLMAFGGTSAAVIYDAFFNNLNTTSNDDLANLLGTDRPKDPTDPNAGKALNVLVLGSDHRSEDLKKAGDKTPGMRSDTAMLVHISSDRSHVEVISIPRDTMVELPSCVVEQPANGTPMMSKPQKKAMFNSAFQIGAAKTDDPILGAACAMKTLELATGITIHDFIVVDFDGFAAMIDAIDGVTLCVPTKINDKMTGTFLEPGWAELKGDQALGYVRARHGVSGSDGSDINRMDRQQKFISALMRKILSADTLANPTKALPLLSAVTKSLTASADIVDAQSLMGLGFNIKDIDTDNIRFLTAPFEGYPADNNRLQFSKKADELWKLLVEDKPLSGFDPNAPATSSEESGGAAAGAESPAPDTAAPAADGETDAAPIVDPFESKSGATDPDDAVCGPAPQ